MGKRKYSSNPHVRKRQYESFGQSDVTGYPKETTAPFKMGFALPRKGR